MAITITTGSLGIGVVLVVLGIADVKIGEIDLLPRSLVAERQDHIRKDADAFSVTGFSQSCQITIRGRRGVAFGIAEVIIRSAEMGGAISPLALKKAVSRRQ